MIGTGGGWGLRWGVELLIVPATEEAGDSFCADTRRVVNLGLGAGRGGGNGEIDTAETDVE